MKKVHRFLALLLCLCLAVGLCACSDRRDPVPVQPLVAVTPPSEREVPQFDEVKKITFDAEAFTEHLQSATAMLEESGREDALIEEYYALTELLTDCLTYYALCDIAYYSDFTDDALQQASAAAYADAMDCTDAYSVWLSEILRSSYRQTYIDEVGEENALQYEDYEAMTEEQKALSEREKELEDEYTRLAGAEYESYGATAGVMAPLYVELVELRNELAESYGYENYVEYAYAESFARSYTPEDARRLERVVKGGLSELYLAGLLAETEEDYEAYYAHADSSEEHLLDLMQRYIPQMAPELGESLDYMLASGSYDIAYSETKYEASFTTMLRSVRMPFLFSQPVPDSQYYSLGTLVHEFGHYHSYLNDPTYARPDGYIYSLDDIDVAEINSTALELLFLRYYPELYGADAAALQRGVLSDTLSNVIYGCMFDEFQQLVYTAEDLQPEDVSEIFHGVMLDYMGDIFIDDYAYHFWALVNHNFDAPLYYISYGVSALAAFQIWMEAQTDADAALQLYLELTAYGTDVDFIGLLETCGMQNVFEKDYLDELYTVLKRSLK